MTKRVVAFVAVGFVLVGCAVSEVGEEAASTEQGLIVGEDENCTVTCGEGTYACCNENGSNTDTCQCISNDLTVSCDVGGHTAQSCPSPGYGEKAPASAGARGNAR